MALFKQFLIPAVRLDTAQGRIENLRGDGIRFEWSISRDNTNTADEATITIYNLAPTLRGAIFEAWQALSRASGYIVEFGIGWDGVPQRAIRGDVWEIVPDSRTPTDVMTMIRIGDGNQAQRDQVVGRTFQNVNIGVVLDYLVQLPPAAVDAGGGGLGLIYPPESKALVTKAASEIPIQSWGNIPAGANTREAVNLIMDTLGLEWRVQNGEFVVMRGGVQNVPPPLLRPGTGLISYARRNDGGIVLQALANPDVQPGVQILVQDDNGRPFAEPAYRVEKVTYTGSTDGDSTMSVEGAKARLI